MAPLLLSCSHCPQVKINLLIFSSYFEQCSSKKKHSEHSTGENVLFTKSSTILKEQVRVHYVRVAGQHKSSTNGTLEHDAIEGD